MTTQGDNEYWWECQVCLASDFETFPTRAEARRAANEHADHYQHTVQVGGDWP